ncbi:MAG: T9SS type A sorting domain-containing protein [Crocinitomicaceae bacterium]|nr:T9SS type A sorting domain-containing protein [Crocinitomicaceae bacterium]
MKLIFYILSALFLTVFSSSNAFGQNEDVIDGFTASEFNGKVLLSWTIKQGNTCNGVKILRSTDAFDFAQIGSIQGICGSSAESIAYEFTDLFPVKNAVNYYRLSLGGVGFSWIVSVEVIDLEANNYLLRPNPISDSSQLYFDNETNNVMKLEVFDPSGVRVHEDQTSGELFILDKQDYGSGLYFFVLSKEGTKPFVSGKFVVE